MHRSPVSVAYLSKAYNLEVTMPTSRVPRTRRDAGERHRAHCFLEFFRAKTPAQHWMFRLRELVVCDMIGTSATCGMSETNI